MYNQSLSRPVKGEVRNHLWTGTKVRKFLTLPGARCDDIIAGIEAGAIGPWTEVFAVERNRKYQGSIVRRLKALGIKRFTVIGGHRIEACVKRILQSHEKEPFDLVFLDFCGHPTKKTRLFFDKIKPIFQSARVAMTFAGKFRGIGKAFHLPEKETTRPGFMDAKSMIESLEFQNYKDLRTIRDRLYWTIHYLFHREYVNIPHATIYRERTSNKGLPMMFIVVDNRSETMKTKKNTWKARTARQAALKAWKTRRINILKKQYDGATRGEKAAITRQIHQIESN